MRVESAIANEKFLFVLGNRENLDYPQVKIYNDIVFRDRNGTLL